MQDASARAKSTFSAACRHHRAGRLDEAIAGYRAAIAINPRFAEAYYNQGNALMARGRRDEAILSYRACVTRAPRFAQAYVNLGVALHERGALDAAIACHRAAIEIEPTLAEAHDNLGNALRSRGVLDEATTCHRRAIALKPDLAQAHANLGNVLHEQGYLDAAIACHRAALALRPYEPGGHNNLGNALLESGRAEEALACHRRAIALKPDFAEAHGNLGNAAQALGLPDEAWHGYAAAVELAPRHGGFHRLLAATGRVTIDSGHFQHMVDLAADPELPEIDRMELHFALGTVYGNAGQADLAFHHLLAGNRLKRARVTYDEAAMVALFARIEGSFTADVFPNDERSADMTPDPPIFIVGMPRSGTTLVEQILSSHPGVFGAGELPDLPRLVGALAPESAAGLPAEKLRDLGATYLAGLRARAPSASRFTDKLPDNFRRIGLIHRMLPNARIIHVHRDPLDTCMSCFSKLFSGDVPYSYDLGELGRYFRAYERLMAHWRRVLPPGVMIEVCYEDLVADLEPQARRLLAHCGLAWDDRCLEFHRTRRSVLTASNAEVRRKLYRNSVGRWVALAGLAGPLLNALAW